MSQKTDLTPAESAPELSKQYLGSLVVASLFVLVLVFSGPWLVRNPLSVFHIEGLGPLPIMYPWIVGAAQTISNGLTEFSGHPLVRAENSLFVLCLISILFTGVLTPTITLLSMGKPKNPFMRGLSLVSLVVCVSFAATILPTWYGARSVRNSLRQAQAVQTNRDNMINEINTIAWKVREYRILPKKLGGGEGSLDGYLLPAILAQTDDGAYTLEQATPGKPAGPVSPVATIRATSKKYPDCSIQVSVTAEGGLRFWTYAGQFR